MRRKLVKILLVLIIAIFSLQLKVQAAVITSTDKQVESNSGSVTISVTSKQALGSFTLKLTDTAGLELENTTKGASSFEVSGDKMTITGSSSDGITSLGSFTFKVPSVTSDTTYRIKFSASGMETTNLDTIADESNTAIVTVKAPVVETPKQETPTTTAPEPEKPTTTTQPAVTKSSEARLKNFGIRPNDFSGFKKDKLEYSTTVPNDVAEVEIYAEKAHDKATVEGTGKVSLKEGNNTFEVKVTAEDGKTTKTYKLTIKRKTAAEQATENAEARLKGLGIKPKEYDFTGFNSEKTEYSVKVPNEVEEIEVYATAMNSSAQITGIGMIDLKEGVNELPIDVIAADGTKKTYTLTVTRKEAEKKEVLGLSILNVQGFNLKPKFDGEIYEYTIDLNKDIDSLEIGTRPTDDEATVEIIGNENLQKGENVITILVKNEETEEVAAYQITVNKNVKTVVGTVTSPEVIQKSWLKPSTWGKEEIIKLAIILVLILLIICAIILKISISRENPKNKNVDLPGADELDRAIAEHQELVEDPNYETEQQEEANSQMEYEQNYIEEIAMSRFGEEKGDNTRLKRRGRHF